MKSKNDRTGITDKGGADFRRESEIFQLVPTDVSNPKMQITRLTKRFALARLARLTRRTFFPVSHDERHTDCEWPGRAFIRRDAKRDICFASWSSCGASNGESNTATGGTTPRAGIQLCSKCWPPHLVRDIRTRTGKRPTNQVHFQVQNRGQRADVPPPAVTRANLIQVTHSINNEVSRRMLLLVPFKCLNCKANNAENFCMSGTILNNNPVPLILNWISFPCCRECELTVCNTVLDQFGDVESKCIQSCANCRKCAADLKCCSCCKAVFYCTKECQLHHWKEGGHKKECYKHKKPNK